MSKSPLDLAHEIAQACISRAPVILLGSGSSAAHGIPGMTDLRKKLAESSPPDGCQPQDLNAWNAFIEKLQKTDLESALNEATLSPSLTRHIASTTWDYLAPFDRTVFERIVQDRSELPLTNLYHHLFKSTHTTINVVTPNYDRVAEYAADVGEFCHFTGFGYGHLRSRSKGSPPRILYGRNEARTVNIWKVHGSLDWFRDTDGVVIGLPVTTTRPGNLDPAIVTPGVEKYRLTADEPFRSIIQGADSAMQAARAFLCIGYGFNDDHLQPMLIERCRAESVPLVMITKQLTQKARSFLNTGKCPHYLAFEKCEDGCILFTKQHEDGVCIQDAPYWELHHFLTMVT